MKKIGLIVNIGVAAALIAAYLGAMINPEVLWYFSPFSIAYPYIAAVNILFILYWIMRKPSYALVSGITLLLNASWLFTWIPPGSSTAERSAEDLKVMTYNVRMFNKYGWRTDSRTLDGMLFNIREEDPDVLLFQEFYHIENNSEYETIPLVLAKQKAGHYYFERLGSEDRPSARFFGLAIFSKYPIVASGIVTKGHAQTKAKAVFADLDRGTDTVRVYNVHLQSLRLNVNEYDFVSDVGNKERNEQVERSKNIMRKFRNATVQRAKEVRELREHIKECPYPIVLGGDFNDTRSSYAYRTIRKELKDAHIASGSGLGNTYRGSGAIPPMRIDFLMYSDDFESFNCISPEYSLSDHEPVIGLFKSKKS